MPANIDHGRTSTISSKLTPPWSSRPRSAGFQWARIIVFYKKKYEGNFFTGEENESDNHLHSHVYKCCELLGVKHQYSLGIEFQEYGDDRFEKSKADAHASIPSLVQDVMSNLDTSRAEGRRLTSKINEPSYA